MTKKHIALEVLACLAVAIPIVFSLLFLGILPMRFNVLIRVSGVVGNGSVETYLCADGNSFMHLYEAQTEFGEQTKVLSVPDLRYDVDSLSLSFFDVDELDIESVDVSSFGIQVSHLDGCEMAPEAELEAPSSFLSRREGSLHMRVKNPQSGAFISIGYKFIPSWFWTCYWTLLCVVTICVSFLLLVLIRRFPRLRLPALCAASVASALLLGAWFCGSLPYVDLGYFLINWALLCALMLFLAALTTSWLAASLVTLGATVWYVANYFVILFRGKPIMPSDLLAVGTAREVAGGYSFVPSWQVIAGMLPCAAYVALLSYLGLRDRLARREDPPAVESPDAHPRAHVLKPGIVRRLAMAVCAVLIVFLSVHNPAFDSLDTFAWDPVLLENFHREGPVLTFLKGWVNSRVPEPEGYSRDEVSDWLAEYQAKRSAGDEGAGPTPTRIIMVMDEALSDLRTVGLNPAIDVMPFMDSLDANTAEGSLYVSVFGGGTCNTEFEALTGMSLAFLGVGAYPYVENVTGPTGSLASYLSSRGYMTTAFHANDAANWNRNKVYPLLGFSDFHSMDDYIENVSVRWLHGHPADETDFAYIEQVDAEGGSPQFLFCVTMQNHSGYEHWEDVQEDQSVADNGSALAQDARVYLSLVKASDDAVRQLVETYTDDEEPTMVVYFGDHQPGLPEEAREGVYTSADTMLDLYKSKFFVWTNYDTEEWHGAAMSANYLPWLILSRGNFSLPPYVRMLGELHEKYPVICAQGVVDAEGNQYTGVSDERIADDPLLRRYRHVQYAILFDELDDAWFEDE